MREIIGDSEDLLQGVQNRLREAMKDGSDFDADFFFGRVVKLLSDNADNQHLFNVLSWVYLGVELGYGILFQVFPEDKYLEVCCRSVDPEQIAEIMGDIKASMADCYPYCKEVEGCLPGQVDRAYQAMGEEGRKCFLKLLAEMMAEVAKLSRVLPGMPIIEVKKESAKISTLK